MKKRMAAIGLMAGVLAACSTTSTDRPHMPSWQLDDIRLFPPDRSLTHAEDGVVLADGTLIVGDWNHGLLAISPEGTSRPFGDFDSAGFTARPAVGWNSPNGISMEPDGRHLLVADITEGFIFRVDTRTGDVTRILDHPYGINSVVRDPSGAIWFTQSTENASGPDSETRMFAAANRPMGDGAVFRIAPEQVGKRDPAPELAIGGLDFANGIAYDPQREKLYVADLMNNRVLAFDVDIDTGQLSNRRALAEVTTPDNLEMDDNGLLWVASPIRNAVVVIDPDSGAARTVFDATPEKSRALAAEWNRRIEVGEPTIELLGPDMWAPLPGLVTGIILTPGGGPVYVSNLGDALIKLDR